LRGAWADASLPEEGLIAREAADFLAAALEHLQALPFQQRFEGLPPTEKAVELHNFESRIKSERSIMSTVTLCVHYRLQYESLCRERIRVGRPEKREGGHAHAAGEYAKWRGDLERELPLAPSEYDSTPCGRR
jgi:hypothetical protein